MKLGLVFWFLRLIFLSEIILKCPEGFIMHMPERFSELLMTWWVSVSEGRLALKKRL